MVSCEFLDASITGLSRPFVTIHCTSFLSLSEFSLKQDALLVRNNLGNYSSQKITF